MSDAGVRDCWPPLSCGRRDTELAWAPDLFAGELFDIVVVVAAAERTVAVLLSVAKVLRVKDHYPPCPYNGLVAVATVAPELSFPTGAASRLSSMLEPIGSPLDI